MPTLQTRKRRLREVKVTCKGLTDRKGQKRGPKAGLVGSQGGDTSLDSAAHFPTRPGQPCAPAAERRGGLADKRAIWRPGGSYLILPGNRPGPLCPVPTSRASAESVSQAGGSPPSAPQLSGLKNEMGKEIHKLRF